MRFLAHSYLFYVECLDLFFVVCMCICVRMCVYVSKCLQVVAVQGDSQAWGPHFQGQPWRAGRPRGVALS